jgi:hypothetical protein
LSRSWSQNAGNVSLDSSGICVTAWKQSMIVPSSFAKRIGIPEPVKKPGRSWIQAPGQ